MEYARRIDELNNNTYWQDAYEKYIKAIMDLECFVFPPAGHHLKLGRGWQGITLHMIFDVKQDLNRKCKLVAGGYLVDMMYIKV